MMRARRCALSHKPLVVMRRYHASTAAALLRSALRRHRSTLHPRPLL